MWKRIDHRKLRNTGSEHAIAGRIYGWEGKLWPRLAIHLYKYDWATRKGLKISPSEKRDTKSWWEDCVIPEQLLSDVIEMLQEYLNSTKQ